MARIGDELLESSDAASVRAALRRLSGGLIAALERDLGEALRGSDQGARRYVDRYRALTDAVLSEGRAARPDLIVDGADGHLTLADANGHPARALLGVLENGSVDAPFLRWTTAFAPGDAVALELVDRLRALVGAEPLAAPAGRAPAPVDDLAARRFQRQVRHYLDREDPLRRLMTVFALSKAQLGRLFGVTRQSIDGWLAHGVPGERQEKLATLLALADLLERKLKSGRIPGVARRPAEAYGGATMLELIAADRERELLERVRASFDWSQAA